MLSRIKELFAIGAADGPPPDAGERIRLATCVVLLEVAQVNDEFSVDEREHIVETMRSRYSLDPEDATELVEEASVARYKSVDVWQYTRLINDSCTLDEKIRILEEVWRAVYADGYIDGHEDHLARRLAKLLNLTSRESIDAKVRVLGQLRERK